VQRGPTGDFGVRVDGDETVRAFIPRPLPPDPPIQFDTGLQLRLEEAHLALGRLDAMAILLPNTSLFLYTYVRKEAVLSSQIEGTQSSLSDLLLFELDEAPGVPLEDASEVSSYVAALQHGLSRLRGNFPLSGRLLREIHTVLLSTGRGSQKQHGEFRRSQNWIGGTRPGNARFVPPPHDAVADCMAALEQFINSRADALPAVVRAGLAHVQFETIHPFLDGNGRVGRLLVTLMLCDADVLREPLLYISLYLKHHRDVYFELLERVRAEGDWEAWLHFFLTAVISVANATIQSVERTEALFRDDRASIEKLGRRAGSAVRVHDVLMRRPVQTITSVANATGLSFPTAASSLEQLTDLGIVRELTGRQRDRVYAYGAYLDELSQGM
jgi:Fic family protein